VISIKNSIIEKKPKLLFFFSSKKVYGHTRNSAKKKI